MSKQEIIFFQNTEENLTKAIQQIPFDKLFILTDENTQRFCVPLIQEINGIKGTEPILIGAGDIHKTLETLAFVWKTLGDQGASRHSLLINLGGGMVTD